MPKVLNRYPSSLLEIFHAQTKAHSRRGGDPGSDRRGLRPIRPYLNGKQIICLNIPDEFTFMDPRLIALLQAKVPQFLDHHD